MMEVCGEKVEEQLIFFFEEYCTRIPDKLPIGKCFALTYYD